MPGERTRSNGHKLKYRKYHLSIRRNSLLWWPNIGTGCPERLWWLHSWRYSKRTWTQSWKAWDSWPCLSIEGWTAWFPQDPSVLSYFFVLLFYEQATMDEAFLKPDGLWKLQSYGIQTNSQSWRTNICRKTATKTPTVWKTPKYEKTCF